MRLEFESSLHWEQGSLAVAGGLLGPRCCAQHAASVIPLSSRDSLEWWMGTTCIVQTRQQRLRGAKLLTQCHAVRGGAGIRTRACRLQSLPLTCLLVPIRRKRI